MNFDLLWKGDYLSVISPSKHPYETILEKNGMAVMPIINNKIGIRKELIPPYLIKDTTGEELYYTLITGQIDEGENNTNPINTVIRELKEEAGLDIHSYNVLWKTLDIPLCKSTTLHTSVYILDIDNYTYDMPKGDGGVYEKASKTVWVTPSTLENIINQNKNIDYLLVSMFYVLKDVTRTRFFWSD